MGAATDKTWTYALTNSNGDGNTGIVLIDFDYAFKKIAIVGTSTTACTVIGAYTPPNGLAPTAINLTNGQSLTILANDNAVLDGITITCPAGATCSIVGQA